MIAGRHEQRPTGARPPRAEKRVPGGRPPGQADSLAETCERFQTVPSDDFGRVVELWDLPRLWKAGRYSSMRFTA